MGDYFADCGGVDEPTFGCLPDGDGCRWFSGGCAPDGYVLSGCPPDDVCCYDEWPFPHDTFVSGRLSEGNSQIYFQLYSMAPSPWDAERGVHVDVELDPALEPGTRSVECMNPRPYLICEDESALYVREPQDDTPSLYIRTLAGLQSNIVLIEVLPGDGGGHAARACVHPGTDASGGEPTCPGYFASLDSPAVDCAQSGTLRLNAIPEPGDSLEDLAGRLDVSFADGFRIVASF